MELMMRYNLSVHNTLNWIPTVLVMACHNSMDPKKTNRKRIRNKYYHTDFRTFHQYHSCNNNKNHSLCNNHTIHNKNNRTELMRNSQNGNSNKIEPILRTMTSY